MRICFLLLLFTFQSSLVLSQTTAQDFFKIGKDYEDQNKYEQAIEYFTRALSIDSNFVDAYYERALAKVNGKTKDHPGAIKDMNEVLTRDPNNRWALSFRANFKYAAADYVAAIDDLDKLIELKSIMLDVQYLRRGKAKMMLKKYDEALSDFNKLIGEKVSGQEAFDALYLRTLIEIERNNYDSALVHLEFISEANPFYRDVLMLQGILKFETSKFVEAIQVIEKAIEYYPDLKESYLERFFIQDELLGDEELYKFYSHNVINDFLEKTKSVSSDHYAYFLQGLLFVNIHEIELAKDKFDKAIQIKKRDSKPYYWRGKMSLELKNYTDALQDFDKAIKLNKQYADAYFNRALTHLEMDVFDNVCNDLLKAKELGNTKAASWYESGCN